MNYRWHWVDDLQKWGLMIGSESSPSGLVFEEKGQAYWIPFGDKVVGRVPVPSVEEGKKALLRYFQILHD